MKSGREVHTKSVDERAWCLVNTTWMDMESKDTLVQETSNINIALSTHNWMGIHKPYNVYMLYEVLVPTTLN